MGVSRWSWVLGKRFRCPEGTCSHNYLSARLGRSLAIRLVAVPPRRDDRPVKIEQSRRLPDGRVLTWTRVRQTQACSTALDYNTDGKVDGGPISDDELGRLILGR